VRNYSGTDKRDPDAIQKIDYFLQDVAAAMGRIESGRVPSGSGTTVFVAGGGGAAADLTGVVTLADAQTITGLKTVTGTAASELFLLINSSDGFRAAALKVQATETPGIIALPMSDEGADTTLLGSFIIPAAGELVMGVASADGHTEPLPIGSAGEVLTVASGAPSWEPLPALADHDHTATAGDGGTIPSSSVTGLGTMAAVASPCPIANGGTGQTTLAAAGIQQVVATYASGNKTASIEAEVTLLATGHAAGFYRWVGCARATTAGGPGDYCQLYLNYKDGTNQLEVVVECFPTFIAGAYVGYAAILEDSTVRTTFDFPFYSDGGRKIGLLTFAVLAGGAVYDIRARLVYCGA
jgi:hypothetical protein